MSKPKVTAHKKVSNVNNITDKWDGLMNDLIENEHIPLPKAVSLADLIANQEQIEKPTVGEYRLIPCGTKIWSINSQTNLATTKDEIIEITHTTCYGDLIFVKRKDLLFNLPGHIPYLIDSGTDEWELCYRVTSKYEIPASKLLEWVYNKDDKTD